MPPKILLADDSVTVQKVIELTFHDEGMDVVAVGDGQRAIDLLEKQRYDIVLADVSMPERDGYAVAAFVKSEPALAGIPVILMTGAFEQLDEQRAREVQCDGVLSKPFEPQAVIALVRQLLGTAHQAGHPALASSAMPTPAPSLDERVPPTDELPTRRHDDYLDRLDDALSARLAAPPVRVTPERPQPDADIERRPDAASSALPSVAEAFTAVLANELEERPLPAWQPQTAAPVPADQPVISDALVDAVARRVVEQMSDTVVRELARERFLDIAERVVRDEIERIKQQG